MPYLAHLHGNPATNGIRQLTIVEMDASLIPGKLIIIGDVHGCLEQLKALVSKCEYNPKEDLVILVGDFINKGPNSLGVMQYCREIGAYGVLGNHDLTLLGLRTHSCRDEASDAGEASGMEQYLSPSNTQGFSGEDIDFLARLPHVIRIPFYGIVVLHAGAHPALPLHEQDLYDVMHCRKVDTSIGGRHVCIVGTESGVGGTRNRGEAWAKCYDGKEKIIFGHDARAGFQDESHAMGLDTGCYYGFKVSGSGRTHELTAVVYSRIHKDGKCVSVYDEEKEEAEQRAPEQVERDQQSSVPQIQPTRTVSHATPTSSTRETPIASAKQVTPAAGSGGSNMVDNVMKDVVLTLFESTHYQAIVSLTTDERTEKATWKVLKCLSNNHDNNHHLMQMVKSLCSSGADELTKDFLVDLVKECSLKQETRSILTDYKNILSSRDAAALDFYLRLGSFS